MIACNRRRAVLGNCVKASDAALSTSALCNHADKGGAALDNSQWDAGHNADDADKFEQKKNAVV